MKWTKGATAGCIFTALILLAAIVLPSHISTLGDLALLGQIKTEDIGAANLAFVYSMTTAERINLLQKLNQSQNITVEQNNVEYSSNQMSMEQAFLILEEELGKISTLEGGPLLSLDFIIDGEYGTLVNLDNSNQSVGLWSLTVTAFAKDGTEGILRVLMDAETGRIYSFSLSGQAAETFLETISVENVADGVGRYLGLGLPTEIYENEQTFNSDTIKTCIYVSDGLEIDYTIAFAHYQKGGSGGYFSWHCFA